MIYTSARRAVRQLFSASFRSVLWKSLGLTLALLIGLWFVVNWGFSSYVAPLIGPQSWMSTIFSWLIGAGMIFGLVFLIAPATSIFGGFFIDDIAVEVEDRYYPQHPRGRPVPSALAAKVSLKFTLVVVGVNLLALMLLLVPGVNIIIFFAANGYLLGREYFEFAAMRHMSPRETKVLRKNNAGTVFTAGLLVAGFMAIPLLNLLTPLFAAAMMMHVFKGLQGGAMNRA